MKRSSVIVLGLIVLLGAVFGWLLTRDSAPIPDETAVKTARAEVLKVEDDRMTIGNVNAPVKMVEYADILCPYCAKAHLEILPELKRRYIDDGKLHFEMRLIGKIAPDSQRAAEGAYCAAEQGKFWDYVDTVYQKTWNDYYAKNAGSEEVPLFGETSIYSFAGDLDLNEYEWKSCMDKRTYRGAIEENKETMSKLEVFGNPHFVINGEDYNGAPPFSAFKAVIDAELRKDESKR